ncbi:hypothetical protein CDD83_20 [Cordyceps sp. RAO-2017]|nr:hypothetical protein CDD83_20 [Cordyceps sp. RAO-2017]
MPYTPPSHPSPASSAPASPDVSRRSSIQSGSRPALPRSASYLNKHRRTPSINAAADDVSAAAAASSPYALDASRTQTERNTAANLASSVRQSPPPPVDQSELIPKGAIVSPPDSASSGSDEDEPSELRGRQLDSLRDAVSQIPQPRTPSPSLDCAPDAPDAPAPGHAQAAASSPTQMRVSFSTGSLGHLSKGARKLGHVRSATEPHTPLLKSADASLTVSDEETDEDLRSKPPMVRKKSGELVRPALRASHRRPSSVPGTPIFSKAVHFDSHLEHVRHFLQVDRPLAVSAGSSPVDNYESDSEYPFPAGDGKPPVRSPPFEWELLTTNFPSDSTARASLPVRLERVWLSADQKSMFGSVAVANLAFQKHISCRFTLDYWKTVSEVSAEYTHDVGGPRDALAARDRFTFAIKLSDMANLESKTLFFCVRYVVDGCEYWDNNASTNFQVDFRKKHLPQKGKNGFGGAASRPLNGLPRSGGRRTSAGSALRPVSMPACLDAFGHEPNKINFDQPIHEYLGESGPTGLRLTTKSSANLATDNLARNLTAPSGVVFSNRYDFGASLSAAMQAAKDASLSSSSGRERDTLYMKRNVRGFEPAAPGTDSPSQGAAGHSPSGTQSPNPSLPSASYEELVNKYCFFGSKQSSPTMSDGTLKGGAFDGPKAGGGGYEASGAAEVPRTGGGSAMHHSIRLDHSASSYFPTLVGAGPTPPTAQPTPGQHLNTHFSIPISVTPARPTPPTLASGAGTPPSDVSYHGQQQALSDRFPWTTDTQPATAILG